MITKTVLPDTVQPPKIVYQVNANTLTDIYQRRLVISTLCRKIDPRILWTDITMRMRTPQRTAKGYTKWNNRIENMQRRIWAKHYHLLPWFNRNPVDTTNIHNALRERNIPLRPNTMRGLTPGLKDPVYRSLSHVPFAIIAEQRSFFLSNFP